MIDYRDISCSNRSECFTNIIVFEFISIYDNVGIFLSPQIISDYVITILSFHSYFPDTYAFSDKSTMCITYTNDSKNIALQYLLLIFAYIMYSR